MNTTPPKQPPRALLASAHFFNTGTRSRLAWSVASSLAIALAAGVPRDAHPADHPHEAPASDPHAEPAKKASPPVAAAPTTSGAKTVGEQVREAVESGTPEKKTVTLVVNGKEKKFISIPAKEEIVPAEAPPKPAAVPAARHGPAVAAPRISYQYNRARTAALTGHSPAPDAAAAPGQAHGDGEVHWSYQGANGPQAWGKLKPDFSTCALGKRQSPINIEESATLQGPAEPLQFSYQPSSGMVVNNGHTIQVDLSGDNTLSVRGSTYKLVQFHFPHAL